MTATPTPAHLLEDDLKPIRDALALGPTPGPWRLESGESALGRFMMVVTSKDFAVHYSPLDGDAEDAANGRFIEAANPERIARLLAHIAELERDAARWRFDRWSYTSEAQQDGFPGLWYHKRDGMTEDEQDAAIDKLRAAIASEAKG